MREHLEVSLHSASWWVGDHDIYAMLVDMAALQRDEAGIRNYAPLAEELAVRYGHVLYQAVARRAWGIAERLAGLYAASAAHLYQALDGFTGMNARWQMGRTLFELGELAAVQGDKDQARNYYTRALAEFQAMRAAPDAERTGKALKSLG